MANKTDQVRQASALLTQMKDNIYAEDRKQAITELNLSAATISEYLNGTIRDLATGIKIISFFSGRINQRQQLLNELSEQA